MTALTAVALGVAGCGGGGTKSAAPGTGVTSTVETSVPSSSGAAPTTAPRVRARLPGPPGPSGPPPITEAVATWHPLVQAGVPGGQCRALLESVQGPLGRNAAGETGGPPYVSLYKGIAEGCLGQLQAARRDLGQARQVGLGPDETSKDTTCNAQLLLVFGFDAFLNQTISPVCPRPTSTTREATSTTRPPRSTTRAPTTTAG